MDPVTQRHIDMSMQIVRAENDSKFSRLEAKIDQIQTGATWQQNAGVMISGIVVGLGLVFSILAYASDRFDSGVGAMGAINEALDSQRQVNAAQDARLDRILDAVEALSVQSQTGAERQD